LACMSALRGGIVYRALTVAVLGTTVVFAQFGARRQRATPSTGPRALAVVIPVSAQAAHPGEKSAASNDQYIVLPVTLFYQGHYYDAATYKANPAPMALWAETVYEVQRSGEPLGTLSSDTDTNTAGGWQ